MGYGQVAVRPVEFVALDPEGAIQRGVSGRVEIVGHNGPVAQALVVQLTQMGIQAQIAERFAAPNTGLIVTALEDLDPEQLHWTALEQAQAFRAAGGKRLVILQLTGGRFDGGPDGGWRGGLSSLAKTAAREWADIEVQAVDVAAQGVRAADVASNILRAMGAGEVELGIGVEGESVVPVLANSVMPIAGKAVPLAGAWLVTGGARGVTAACVRETAAQAGGTFVLLGRSSLTDWPAGIAPTRSLTELRRSLALQAKDEGRSARPAEIDRQARAALASDEIRINIAAIQRAGGQAIYKVCDLMDEAAARQTIEHVRGEFGTITGLVHGAGVLADRLIVETRREEFERVFRTKVTGLKTVLDCLDLSTLRHVGLFSSAAARYGNTGQVSYAMANDVLNRVARHLHGALPDAKVTSFNWGPWEGGMVDAALARHFEDQGIGLIPIETGARIFADQMLRGDRRYVELLIGDEWTV